MKTLGIDQSYTSSGIIILEDDIIIEAHKYSADKEKDRFGQAYEIALHIAGVVDEHEPDIIAIEGLAFGMRGNVTRDLGGLQFVIVSHLQEVKKRNVEILAPTSVKKYATGSGRAKKNDMIDNLPETVYTYFTEGIGLKKSTGLADLADAYWIAKHAAENKELDKKE